MTWVPDPSLHFSHPANNGLVAALRQARRAPAETDAIARGRLDWLAAGLPEHCAESLYGAAILATHGIIFAAQLGGGRLALRLAHADAAEACAAGARPDPCLGPDWFGFDEPAPLPEIAVAWSQAAYRYACLLLDRPYG